MNLRREDKALEMLEYPQIQYNLQGGYGEPTTIVAVGSAVGGLVGNLMGMKKQEKTAIAQMEAQERAAKQQALIQGQIASQQAQVSARHAANMPYYLLIGGTMVVGLGIVITKRKK